MKKFLAALLTFASLNSYANSEVSATATPNTTGPAYEVVIDGDVAKKLYTLIKGENYQVTDGPLVWENRAAKGILCGKIKGQEQYACSLTVDSKGIQ